MKNQIQKFVHARFGEIKTVTREDGMVWFVGKDVADVLEYQNGSRDINRHVDKGDRKVVKLSDGLQTRSTIIINISGLYSLIMSSKLPQAKAFKHWVTSEVLPQIAKTGGYIPMRDANGEMLSAEEVIAQAKKIVDNTIDLQQRQIEQMQKQLDEQQPKVEFAEAVGESQTSIYIGELAKLIARNGVEIGQNRLFKWLRDKGYIFQHSTEPIQMWVERGLFSVHISLYEDRRGRLYEHVLTKVTPKGQEYFVRRFLKYEL